MKNSALFFNLLFIIVLASSSPLLPMTPTPTDAVEKLHDELEYIFSDPAFSSAHWGVAVQSMKTGEYFYLRNEHKAFMPASNMKLFTTAAALQALGADYRFVTRLQAHGVLSTEGILDGDVIIRGCGDPSLSGRWEENKITAVFERWADSLKAKGIKEIHGKIIGDDRYFSGDRLGHGWEWDDLTEYYAAQISALTFNDNCIDILTSPGDSLDAPARIKLEPDTRYVQIINRIKTDERTRPRFWRNLGTNQIQCDGTVSWLSKGRRDRVTIENPARYAAFVLREILVRRGIVVTGEAFDVDELPGYLPVEYRTRQLASHTSPPLSEIVKATNKDSDNLFAELLLRTVGRESGREGNAGGGEAAAKKLFEAAGIAPDQFYAMDGSGLSRSNLVSPVSVIRLLRYMRQQPAGAVYVESLPVAGVDGTLKNRLRGTAAKGNVKAKTGSIGRVRALSGYVTTRDGEELVFSMIANNYGVPMANATYIQDLVCERLANFTRSGD